MLGVIRTRAFVADPKSVNAHLQNFLHLVLADGLDAGKGEDRGPFAALQNAVAELHRALFVEQKILVDDQKNQARIEVEIPFHDVVNVTPGRQQLDVLAGEEMRGAAKVAAVRAAEAGENFPRAGNFPAKHLEPAHDERVFIRHRNFRLAQQPAEIPHTFLTTDKIRIRLEHFVLQHRAVAAEHDLAVRRVLADQRDRLLHLVHQCHDERDAHVIVSLFEFLDELAFGRVLQHHRRGVEVLGDVVEAKLHVHRARTENPLRACDLAIKEFVTDRRRVTVLGSHRTADTGQKNFFAHGLR